MRYEVSIVDVPADVGAPLAEALSLIGWRPSAGEPYLLKPNMLNPKSSEAGVTTDPHVISALVSFLRAGGCGALVGDSPGNAYPGRAREVFEATGMLKAVEEADASFVEFESLPPKVVEIDGKVIKSMALAAQIFKSRVINVPKLKTHVQTMMTGALKNVAFGCIPGSGKGAMHIKGNSPERIASAIVDVYSAIRPRISLNVMDAIICMEGNGPSAGKARRIGKLLASTDALALDMVSFRLAGVEPKAVPYVKEAMDRSLGPCSFDEIEIHGEMPSNIKFKLPSTYLASIASSLGGAFTSVINSSVSFNQSKCTRCGSCAAACPVSAITIGESVELDRSKCIRCFVCYEMCEQGAIKVKRPIFRR